MDNPEALMYKKWLNSYIDKCLRLSITFGEIWDSLVLDEEKYKDFSSFLNTSIGKIWLKKDNGSWYRRWQEGEEQ
jgi:hypothetical protein